MVSDVETLGLFWQWVRFHWSCSLQTRCSSSCSTFYCRRTALTNVTLVSSVQSV